MTFDLLVIPSWRQRSINTARLVDYLLIEHRKHAELENGNLRATYDQLAEHGLTRSEIKAAILEAGFLGLVKRRRTRRGEHGAECGLARHRGSAGPAERDH